jgi:hypothetical protein
MKSLYTKLFKVPVLATEQNPKALGSTVAELDLSKLGDLHVRFTNITRYYWNILIYANLPPQVGTYPKTKFSMFLPEVHAKLNEHRIQSVVLFGIEVCNFGDSGLVGPVADLSTFIL